MTNGLGSDTLRKEAVIFSGVDYPLDLGVWRSGDATASIDWIPGANNTQVVICRRDDFYPPHPNNAVRVYYGAAGGGPITDSGLRAWKEYFYRIWGIRDGVLSDGYRSAEIVTIPPEGIPCPWELFSPTLSCSCATRWGLTESEGAMELYYYIGGHCSGIFCSVKAKGRIETSARKLSGKIGCSISDTPTGGIRIRVNGSIVWSRTEEQFGGAPGDVRWVDVSIPLSGGGAISNFELEFERYHPTSFAGLFAAYFMNLQLSL